MARVKMLATAAGPNGSHGKGAVYDLPDDLALAYVEAGAATLLGDPVAKASAPQSPIVERAVVVPPETTLAPNQSRRKR